MACRYAQRSLWRALVEEIVFAPPKRLKESLAVNRLYLAALNVVVAGIERTTHLGHLFQISGHGVFHQIIGGTAALHGQVVKAGFSLRLKMHFHAASVRFLAGPVKLIANLRDATQFMASIFVVPGVIRLVLTGL